MGRYKIAHIEVKVMANKKLKCALEDAERVVLRLEEPGEPGDLIDVTAVIEGGSTGLSAISKHIQTQIEEKVRASVELQKGEWEKSRKIEIENARHQARVEFESSAKYQELQKVFQQYQTQSELFAQQLKTQKENLEHESELRVLGAINAFKTGNEYTSLVSDKKLADERLNSLKAAFDNEKALHANELAKLKAEQQAEFTLKIQQIEAKNQTKIQELNSEKSVLETQLLHASKPWLRNSQAIGADLEKQLYGEFQNTLGFIAPNQCELIEQPTIVEGEKPDFRFVVYREGHKNGETKPLVSVTIEVKNQTPEGRIKNAKFYPKLERDREHNASEYALLVSTLEPEENFHIKKVKDEDGKYEQMYVCRPHMFITFLSVIYKLYKGLESVLTKHTESETRFKDAEQIRLDFEETRNKVLASLEKLSEKIAEVHKHTDEIRKRAEKIDEIVQEVKASFDDKVQRRIDAFKITSLVKKITKASAAEAAVEDQLPVAVSQEN